MTTKNEALEALEALGAYRLDDSGSGRVNKTPEWSETRHHIEAQAAEIERLKSALAESCDENRHTAMSEAGVTAMCPIAERLEAEKREAVEHIKNVLYGRLLDKNNRNDDGMDMANVGGNRPDFPRWWDDELKKALDLLQTKEENSNE